MEVLKFVGKTFFVVCLISWNKSEAEASNCANQNELDPRSKCAEKIASDLQTCYCYKRGRIPPPYCAVDSKFCRKFVKDNLHFRTDFTVNCGIMFGKLRTKDQKTIAVRLVEILGKQHSKEEKKNVEDGRKFVLEQLETCVNNPIVKTREGKVFRVSSGGSQNSRYTGAHKERFDDQNSRYTGAHKERFDDSGKGSGLRGRDDTKENEGYVGNYKGNSDNKKNDM